MKSQSAALLSIRAPIRQIINEIVQLHERLFTELQRLMPSNEGTQDNAADEPSSAVGHKRWHSADFIFNKFGRPGNQRVVRRSLGSPLGAKALTPITAADAARAFEKFVSLVTGSY